MTGEEKGKFSKCPENANEFTRRPRGGKGEKQVLIQGEPSITAGESIGALK